MNAEKQFLYEIKEIVPSDPGVDDALALLVAWEALANPAIIATFGNGSTEQTSMNLNGLVQAHQFFAKDTKNTPLVFTGADRATHANMPYDTDVQFIHGEKAMEGVGLDFPIIIRKPDAMYEAIESNSMASVDIISLGAVTEVHRMITRKNRLANKINSITMMGGTIGEQGNTDIYQEANFKHDPRALKEILQFTKENEIPITIVPLNVTQDDKLEFTPERAIMMYEELRRLGSPNIANYLLKLLGENSTYSKFYRSRTEVFKFIDGIPTPYVFKGPPIHDLTAILVKAHPELFEIIKLPIKVSDQGEIGIGRTYYGVGAECNVAIALAKDGGEKYWQLTTAYLASHYN